MLSLKWIMIQLVWINALYAFQANPEPDIAINAHLKEMSFIRQLADRLNELESRDRHQEKLIDDLVAEMVDHKEYVKALREEVSEKTDIISTLLRDKEAASKAESDYKTDVETEVSRSRRAVKTNIAFTAGLSHNILNAPAYHNIIFDHVETNVGNGYNSRNGIFTAPVSGTYVFYTSILAYSDGELYCRFVVNGVNKANTYARGTDNRHDQSSQVIVVQLHHGDQVSVQNKMDGDSIFGNLDIWTTFSGFLLHLDTLVG